MTQSGHQRDQNSHSGLLVGIMRQAFVRDARRGLDCAMVEKAPPKSDALTRALPILGWLPHYKPDWLRGDVIAGLTLWGILVPEAIAYAAMAGAPLEAGLYTLLGSLAVYAILGTTRQAVSAPTSGSSIMIAAVLAPFLVANSEELGKLLILLVLVVGIILLLCGLLRLGFVTAFISHSVIGIYFRVGNPYCCQPGSETFWITQGTRRDRLSALASHWAIGRHQLDDIRHRRQCARPIVRT
jgi:hypothetical protein